MKVRLDSAPRYPLPGITFNDAWAWVNGLVFLATGNKANRAARRAYIRSFKGRRPRVMHFGRVTVAIKGGIR